MTMIFRHGFFHGDPHPANILLLDSGELGLVDFGLVGKLTDDDMSKLTRLFIDAATENVDALPRRLAELGVSYPKEREEEFRTRLRELFDRYYGVRLSDLDQVQVMREAFQLIYAMNLHLPTRFVLLDKAIATLGAVGADLYPDFNVFEVAKPYARGLMVERFTPRRMAQRAQREARDLAGIARELPYQVSDILQEMRAGQIEVGFVHKGLDEFMHRLDVVANRLVEADLMGHTTHGLALAPRYLQEIESGSMAKTGEPEVISDRGACVCWNGRRLPGVWLVSKAVDLALDRVAQYGTVTSAIGNSHHIGCLAAYLPRAAEKGFLIVVSSSDPSQRTVAPFGGREALFTPNPIAVGIPPAGTRCSSISARRSPPTTWGHGWFARGVAFPASGRSTPRGTRPTTRRCSPRAGRFFRRAAWTTGTKATGGRSSPRRSHRVWRASGGPTRRTAGAPARSSKSSIRRLINHLRQSGHFPILMVRSMS